MRTWMVKFLAKFQGIRGSKIDSVNSIRVAKPLTFFNILRSVVRYVRSSWAIVFFALSLHLLLLSLYSILCGRWLVVARASLPYLLLFDAYDGMKHVLAVFNNRLKKIYIYINVMDFIFTEIIIIDSYLL